MNHIDDLRVRSVENEAAVIDLLVTGELVRRLSALRVVVNAYLAMILRGGPRAGLGCLRDLLKIGDFGHSSIGSKCPEVEWADEIVANNHAADSEISTQMRAICIKNTYIATLSAENGKGATQTATRTKVSHSRIQVMKKRKQLTT